jgi:hypothetical protein
VRWLITEDVYLAGGVFDDEEDVEPGPGDGIEVEQVAGQNCVGLGAEELWPGRAGPPWCGVDSSGRQDLPGVEAPIWWPRPASSPWMRR